MTAITDKLDTLLKFFPLPGPGINPFDMTFGAVVRLRAGEPVTVAAYQAEKSRVRSMLLNRVNEIRQFSTRRAELALAVWEAWVWEGGSYTDAALLLNERIDRTLSRQSLYHHIKSMMLAGIIPHHRSRQPAKSKVAVTEIHRSGRTEDHSIAIPA